MDKLMLQTLPSAKLDKQKGSISILVASLMPVLIALFFVAIELTNLVNYNIRLRYAVDNSAILVAREGPSATPKEVRAISSNMVSMNLIGRIRNESQTTAESVAPIVDAPVELDILGVSAEMKPKILTHFMKRFGQDLGRIPETRIERYYIPQETALSLDASLSMDGNSLYQQIKDMLIDFVRYGYGDFVQHRDDNWISINAYSKYVNLGYKYKDKLISKESREIPFKWAQVTQDHHYFLSNDLLSPQGGESRRQAACVQRMGAEGGVASYLSRSSKVPTIEADKYLLAEMSSDEEAKQVINTIKGEVQEIPEWMLPQIQYPNDRANHEGIGSTLSCPPMPLLELNNDINVMLSHLDRFYPTLTTGTDTGFYWAWRTLMPEWRTIWTDHPSTPHDYDVGVEKRIIVFSDGGQNEGYGAYEEDSKLRTFYLEACKKMAEPDIRGKSQITFYNVFYDHSGKPTMGGEEKPGFTKDMKTCADLTGGRYIHVGNDEQELREVLKKLSLRQYWTKIIQ